MLFVASCLMRVCCLLSVARCCVDRGFVCAVYCLTYVFVDRRLLFVVWCLLFGVFCLLLCNVCVCCLLFVCMLCVVC